MKNLVFSTVFFCLYLSASAQNYSELKEIPLNDATECKNAEAKVLECADFLLSTPCVEDIKTLNASQFISEWMGKTPAFKFSLDDVIYKPVQSDLELYARYLASQAKVAILERPAANNEDFKLKLTTMFLEYCENPKYAVRLKPKIKKLIEAKNNGTLMETLAKK